MDYMIGDELIEEFRDGIFALRTRRFGTVAEIMIKSRGVTRTLRCSPLAMRERADIGSPWLPVVIITVCSSGYCEISSISMSRPSGIER